MTLPERISNQLQDAHLCRGKEIQAEEAGLWVGVKLTDWDRLGCLLTRLDLKHTDGRPFTLDPARIEEEITYLGERLKVIETEQRQGRTILRSALPRNDQTLISFFEMTLDRDDGVSMIRWAYNRTAGERVSTPAPLTRDSLERLLADLIELIQEN